MVHDYGPITGIIVTLAFSLRELLRNMIWQNDKWFMTLSIKLIWFMNLFMLFIENYVYVNHMIYAYTRASLIYDILLLSIGRIIY